MREVFKYMVAKEFFPKYAPRVKLFKMKMRGLDGNGKPIRFTYQDMVDIAEGIRKMQEDLYNMVLENHLLPIEPNYKPVDKKPVKVEEPVRVAAFTVATAPKKVMALDMNKKI
jgi:hypothetical protein